MTHEIFTVGHSNYSIEKFMSLLVLNKITAVGDVRSQPYSRYTPHFNRESLCEALEDNNIRYVFLGDELGARQEDNDLYNKSGKICFDRLSNYPKFLRGIERVEKGAEAYRLALMCSEKNPMDCHRTHLVAKTLVGNGNKVFHILEDGRSVSQSELIASNVLQGDLLRSDEQTLYETKGQAIAYQKDQKAGE